MSEKTYTEQEEKDLRAKGKELKIPYAHNTGLEKLEEKIAEAEKIAATEKAEAPEDPPKSSSSDDVVAALAARLDVMEEENKLLKERLDGAEAGPQVGNSNVVLYHKEKAPEGRQMTVAEAETLQKKDKEWVDTPASWRTKEQTEPKKVPGEMYEGKVLPGGPKKVAARADGSKAA